MKKRKNTEINIDFRTISMYLLVIIKQKLCEPVCRLAGISVALAMAEEVSPRFWRSAGAGDEPGLRRSFTQSEQKEDRPHKKQRLVEQRQGTQQAEELRAARTAAREAAAARKEAVASALASAASKAKSLEAIAQHLTCPITHALMLRPVMARDGNTYERQAIRRWLRDHDTGPKTRARLSDKSLVRNRGLQSIVDEVLRTQPDPDLLPELGINHQEARCCC